MTETVFALQHLLGLSVTVIVTAVQSVNASSLQMFGETLIYLFIYLSFHSQALFVPI